MRPARLERATYGFGGRHSIQLSYGRGAAVIIMAVPESTTSRGRTKSAGPISKKTDGMGLSLDVAGALYNLSHPRYILSPIFTAGAPIMNIIDTLAQEQQKTDVTKFKVGDGVRVHTRVREGDKERIQIFSGIVIGRKGTGLNQTFTVRRISYGEGVERVFPVHSPRIAKVEVEKQGRARRAKLNYLRSRQGKEATAIRE